MSGGTDSSVAAMLLQSEGYEVIGVTLRLWDHSGKANIPAGAPQFIIEAKELANSLNIPHHVVDARKDFKDNVIRFFVEEYLAGRTPSPCIHCNPNIKWKLLIEKANELGCDYIATGHYVKIKEERGFYYIHKGKDPAKDQSYFLWNLNQDILSRTLTPLGNYTKQEVRDKAREFGFREVAEKKESMGVCFVENMDYRNFLKQQRPDLDEKIGPGRVIDTKGNELGTHMGYPYYTVGQKRDLELKEKKGLMVSEIIPETNTLVLDHRNNLNRTQFRVRDYYLINRKDIQAENIRTIVRGLGLNPEGYSRLHLVDETLMEIELDNAAWAIAPGQPVAFYIEDRLIGGGFAE
jgi:tRNA-specific 2-thiouridylase